MVKPNRGLFLVDLSLVHKIHEGRSGKEFCRSRIIRQADWEATRLNVLTSGHVSAAMRPLDYETDREMLEAALTSLGSSEPREARVLWIADTLHLAELECSAAYLEEARRRDDLEVLGDPRPLPLDGEGNLPDRLFGTADERG